MLKWILKENTEIAEYPNLAKPIEDRGRFYYDLMEYHSAGVHAKEARRLFLSTQFKRILRLFSNDKKYHYFSEDDLKNIDQFYHFQKPLKMSNRPVLYYIGHSSLLLQLVGINILIDPVFGHLNPLFYPRKTKPGLQTHELPHIDIILISHNHYDHCELPTLKEFVSQQPLIIVPIGDGSLVKQLGFKNVLEQRWWHKAVVTSKSDKNLFFEFYATPAKHWSGRTLLDSHRSLCLGWIIRSSTMDKGVYYAGDTARMDDFIYDQIRENLPEVFVNIEPGGPNQNRELLKNTHQSLPESIETHFRICLSPDPQILEEKVQRLKTIIVHHNTFEFGVDSFNDNIKIWREMVNQLDGRKKTERQDLLNLAKEEIKNLLKLPLKKEILIKVLKKNIIFPKIGEIIYLDDLISQLA